MRATWRILPPAENLPLPPWRRKRNKQSSLTSKVGHTFLDESWQGGYGCDFYTSQLDSHCAFGRRSELLIHLLFVVLRHISEHAHRAFDLFQILLELIVVLLDPVA